MTRRESLVGWIGLIAGLSMMASLAAAALTPLLAAEQVPSSSGASEQFRDKPSALALIGIGVAVASMDVGDQQTQLTVEVRNRADRGYQMARVKCTLYDENGTVLAIGHELIWGLGAGQVAHNSPTFWHPVRPKSAKCRAVNIE